MVKDMTEGSSLRHIISFAWPLLLGSILQQAYNLIDAAIVGHWLGMNPLAAVGASSSVIFLILGFCNGSTAGFGIPIAQRFGAHDYSEMRRYVYNSYRLVAKLSLALALVTSLLCGQILHWIRIPEEIFRDSYLYLLVIFLGIPFTMLYNLLASIIRALGDSKTPFYFLIVSAIFNVCLDMLFIIVFHWGAVGAAIATVMAQAISAVLCLIFMRTHFPILGCESREESSASLRHQGRLLAIGAPMGLQFSITAIGSIMLQSANNALGTGSVTAFTVAMRIKMLFISPGENLGIAMATYCGQNFGAGKIDRIRRGLWTAFWMVVIYALIGNAIMFPLAERFAKLFVYAEETEIISMVVEFLNYSSPCWFFLGLLCVLRYAIQGLGYTRLAMMSGVFEMVDRAVVSIWLVPALGFTGVCLGDPTAWIAACVFLVPAIVFVYQRIKKIAILENHEDTIL